MKFSEYMEIRGNGAISKVECEVFGIEKNKGWIKKYSNLEISQQQINKVITLLNSKSSSSLSAICRIQSLHKENYVQWEGKYLYLMKNEIGNLKIGISSDPIKRSRNITNSGGALTQCIAYWRVSKEAREIESFLLKKWVKFKTYGEWFKAGSFNLNDIEKSIDCSFERIFYNEEWENFSNKNIL